MSKTLQVYWGKNIVGSLMQDGTGNFSFQYTLEWLQDPASTPLSIRLPLREEIYSDSFCRIFFSNLLPEGNIRALIAKKLGISETNDFDLLKSLGGDCAGALTLVAEGENILETGDYVLIPPPELQRMIEGMTTTPLLVWKDEWRLSLAGAQQKLPVFIQDEKIYLPKGAYPSSHILKPEIPGFSEIVENETFCMRLAKKVGLPVPEVTLLKTKVPIYLVERYDRHKDEKGNLIRLHQEDFCQALGFRDNAKYEAEGGPNLKNSFSLISEHGTQPILDKKFLIQWVLFNTLIGNCDAHAKNLSMLITREDYRLSPLYDLISTRVYPSLSKKLAMKIGGEDRAEWILLKHLEKFAEEAGVSTKAVSSICLEICETLPKFSQELMKEFVTQYGAFETIKKIVKNISSSSKRILACHSSS